MPKSIIRPARPADEAAIVAIARAAYGVYVPLVGREPPPMVADFKQPIADGHVWVATMDDVVQAYLVARTRDDHFLLENVAVSPGAQGTGIGRALVEYTEHLARELGHARIELYTHVKMTGNIAWYSRLGFTETDRAAQAGMERVFFVKHL